MSKNEIWDRLHKEWEKTIKTDLFMFLHHSNEPVSKELEIQINHMEFEKTFHGYVMVILSCSDKKELQIDNTYHETYFKVNSWKNYDIVQGNVYKICLERKWYKESHKKKGEWQFWIHSINTKNIPFLDELKAKNK